MSKSKPKNFRVEEKRYQDGFHVDKRKEENKFDKKFINKVIKTKNIEELIPEDYDEFDDYYDDDYLGGGICDDRLEKDID